MGRQSGLTKFSDPKTRHASLCPSVTATATISRPDDRAHGSPGHRAGKASPILFLTRVGAHYHPGRASRPAIFRSGGIDDRRLP
jgi:hypothetical protein